MVFFYLKQLQYTISEIGCSIKMVFFYLKQLFNSTILRRLLF